MGIKNKRAKRLEIRDKSIVERYMELSSWKYTNRLGEKIKMLTEKVKLAMLGDEFHLSEHTIEAIINGRKNYKLDEEV